MKLPRKTSITHERVRWADVDLVGIMRYTAFGRLIELAEQELLREAGMPFSEVFTNPEFWLPRRHLEIDYLAPVRIDELLELETYLSSMSESTMIYHVDVRNEAGVLVAVSKLVVVTVSTSDFAKVPLDSRVRSLLSPYVGDPEAVRARRGGIGE